MSRRYAVELSSRAQAELDEATLWWRANRSAPELLDREMAAAFDLLARHPESGAPTPRPRRPDARRLLLRKTQYHIYYYIEGDVVRVLSIWHTARVRPPRL